MAMRPRGGSTAPPRRGGRTGGVRPVYEDFRPVSEWQQDDESHILNIYLPGFMKEQIKVLTEGKNTVRVGGERLVAGNKWNRFMEDYQVPENGDMNSVSAKFQGGILIIKVPKKELRKPQEALPPTPKSHDVQKQYAPQKGQDKVSSEASASQTKDEKSPQPQKVSGDRHTPQKGQDKAFPIDEKSLEQQKASSDPRKEYDRDGHQKDKRNISPLRDTRNAVSQDAKKESSAYKEEDIALERQDKITENIVYNEGKKSTVSKELPELEPAKKTKLEKDGPKSIPEKKADNKELYGAVTKEKYKKAVKGLAELNEERQLLVNMGVAMLVIVALTAYVTYTFASRKDKT